MRTIITGLPSFGKDICGKLADHFPDDTFSFLNTYYDFWDRVRFLALLPFADVIYSINGATHGSKTIDLAIFFRRRIVLHWVGSDVMNAKSAFQRSQIDPDYIHKPVHIADAPWLVDELSEIGIPASYVPLNTCIKEPAGPSEFPDKFSILTYIPKGKEKFYGMDYIIRIAQKFPEVEIRVAGLDYFGEPLPRNIRLLGWIGNMAEQIKSSTVCIRFPEHDGLSFFVLESLAAGRYVIYNKPFDPCIFADRADLLEEKISELKGRFELNELEPNTKGMAYVWEHFSAAEVVRQIHRVLQG